MKKHKNLSLIIYGVSIVYALIVLGQWLFGSISGYEFGFTLLNFYILLPIITFISALILGLSDAYLKFLYPIFVTILCGLLLFIVYRYLDIYFLVFSLLPASIGLIIGMRVNKK